MTTAQILAIIGMALELTGTILLAAMVILVHLKLKKEHTLDAKVFYEISLEKKIGGISIILLIIGFAFQIYSLVI